MPTQPYHLTNGEKVPGVTTVLSNLGWNKEALMAWANVQGLEGRKLREARDDAADTGTLAHALITLELGGEAEIPRCEGWMERAAGLAVDAFKAWKADARFARVVETERGMVSERLRCGGTLDLVYEDEDGKRWVTDWKCGEKPTIYPESRLQGAAYCVLWNETNPGLEVHGTRVVRLPTTLSKNGRPRNYTERWWTYEEQDADRLIFEALTQIHHAKHLIHTRRTA
jgi:hypothetical protein